MKLLFVALITLGAAMPAAAQDPLNAARELYASADYEQALEKLGNLRTPETTAPVLEQVEQYRAFCLFALGRTADAQAVAESLVKKNPMLELDATDASPRLSAMFTDVRRRLLPALIRDRYRLARAAIDSKNFAAAEPQLIEVRVMISDAEKLNAMDEGMADLRVLVDGFIDLTHSLRENAADQKARADVAAAEKIARVAASTPPAQLPTGDSSQANVTPPVIVRQDLPQVPASLMPMFKSGVTAGQIDVLIDEFGNVEETTVRQSLQPVYDAIVLRAARMWRYRPARNGTTPVKYVKTIAVVVQK
jgi:tetratricopeptide (TPR) repeat protein